VARRPAVALLVALNAGVAILFFLAIFGTGLGLAALYLPSGDPFTDPRFLDVYTPAGMVLRNLHRWLAPLCVPVVALNLVAVVVAWRTGSPRRGLLWGMALVPLLLGLWWTGHRLPWDELSNWAVTVGTKMSPATPLLGHDGPFAASLGSAGTISPRNEAQELLAGGPSSHLGWTWWLHCVVLPLACVPLLVVDHRWLLAAIRRQR
jgi:quinol-cytochrome oxidoreductase complex cytochrome b subunit